MFDLQSAKEKNNSSDLSNAIPSDLDHGTLTFSLLEKRHRDLVLVDTLLKAIFVHHWSRVKIRVPPSSDQKPHLQLSIQLLFKKTQSLSCSVWMLEVQVL